MALLLRGPAGELPLKDGLVIGRKSVGLTDIKISRNHLLVERAVTGAFTIRREKSNPTWLRRAGAETGDDVEIGAEPVQLRAGDRIWIQNRKEPPEPLEEADTARTLEVIETGSAHAQAREQTRESQLTKHSASATVEQPAQQQQQQQQQRRRRCASPERAAVDESYAKQRRVGDASVSTSAATAATAYPCTGSSTTRHDPAVLVMVGIPGVGKTTFIEKLIGSCGSVTWVRCSQDDEGSRENCLKKARHALSDGVSVAIDRTDFDATQRKHWIDLAHEFGAHTLAL
jgi:hypothetical protein